MKQEKKYNCWEYMKCGREPSGALIHHFGVCDASIEKSLDGIHEGKNAGRACWVVSGSSASFDKVQCVFAKIHKDCEKCDFYAMVKEEENSTFMEQEKLFQRLQQR